MKILLAIATCTFLLSGCSKAEMENDSRKIRENFENMTDPDGMSNVNLEELPSYCNAMIGHPQHPYPHL